MYLELIELRTREGKKKVQSTLFSFFNKEEGIAIEWANQIYVLLVPLDYAKISSVFLFLFKKIMNFGRDSFSL